MRCNFLMTALAAMLLLTSTAPCAGPASEVGKFYLFLQGQSFGSETYRITKDEAGKVTATSESEMLMLEGDLQNRLAFTSRLVMDGQTLNPTYYEYRFKGGRNDGYEVTFDGLQATRKLILNGTVTSKPATLEHPGVLILDYNIYHHYQLLLDRYDQKKKGKQSFSNFVPLVGDEVEITVTQNGDVPLIINQKTIPTINYTIDFPMNYGADIWATKEGRIVKIRMKQNSIEALREEYVMVAQK